MRNYQDEQNKNYENTKQMFEACRKDVGDSKKARRTMPIDLLCRYSGKWSVYYVTI